MHEIYIEDSNIYEAAKKGKDIIILWNDEKIKIPKIKNGHRKINHKTRTELKNIKLMPDSPPVGYGLQQFKGYIFFIFDIEKTKPYCISEEEKKRNKKIP